ncbi:glycosyltransferase family 2 protein [Streptomyces sp. SB3404]|uniref:Glycosyltransferase family 2 protein n=2 Tax=Streptomyces boncukensis TaxID=2711219 RepID=A0A6G4WPT3_9ACTN|nr:glycosyltransferase family 2 protein [Streptomyces boncukensis]
MAQRTSPEDPTFRISVLFHKDLALLSETLPRCLEALTRHTQESYEVVLHCDGTPPETVARLSDLLDRWGVDEMRVRRRGRFVASGDASNNGHRRLFDLRSPYLIVIEDDVVMYRTDQSFDLLAACRRLFERHPYVPVLSKVSDYGQWSWKLEDKGDDIEPGVRSVNRLSTHFIAYDVQRFSPVANRFGGFDLDVFIDRPDLSYNWEDLVSHVGTTGGRHIAFPEGWPIEVFHCDRKVESSSMYHTQDPELKARVLAELEQRFRPGAHGNEGAAA